MPSPPAPGIPPVPPPDTIGSDPPFGLPLTTPGTDTTLWSTDHVSAPYGRSGVDTAYTTNNGILQIPLGAAPGTPPVLIQLHGGFQRKSVGVMGRRAGQMPLLPDPSQIDPDGGVQAAVSVSPKSPELDADGNTYVFTASMALVFYYDKFIGPLTGYRMGAAPVYTTPPALNILDVFSVDIL